MDADMDEKWAGKIILAQHEHDLITPRLAVGSGVYSAVDVDSLEFQGFTHVLDLRGTREGEKLYIGRKIDMNCLPSDDDGTPRKWEWLRDGVRFGCHALREGGKLLVHCAAGWHRSPSMAYAILRVRGMAALDAEKKIVKARAKAKIAYKACVEKHLSDLREMVRRDENGF